MLWLLAGVMALGEALAVCMPRSAGMQGLALREVDLSDNGIGAGDCGWLRSLVNACSNLCEPQCDPRIHSHMQITYRQLLKL